jgi:hypothetical protein
LVHAFVFLTFAAAGFHLADTGLGSPTLHHGFQLQILTSVTSFTFSSLREGLQLHNHHQLTNSNLHGTHSLHHHEAPQ